ncbi:uncharacterized protein BO80DRAFT_218900 [Aspergillus ibericus CBS 121593]|uniref:Uncharacterized protein n=1 Tax=Aspergillus ibericus CBS 121593 TaxID=1448316 RepID=A0A395GMX0_9EURO|nr:hypothetical protein BO80DRAFT_218900 [Aspergillus ibericus CBS 121593]RAK96724.1 hypothetical protein BO80DRAFT_218900 [Aspergillus ibericus CBS 121593]
MLCLLKGSRILTRLNPGVGAKAMLRKMIYSLLAWLPLEALVVKMRLTKNTDIDSILRTSKSFEVLEPHCTYSTHVSSNPAVLNGRPFVRHRLIGGEHRGSTSHRTRFDDYAWFGRNDRD